MTTRGQLFNGEMVRAILAGRKTETRRPITKTNSHQVNFWSSKIDGDGDGAGGPGGAGGWSDLDWDAHEISTKRRRGTPCSGRCADRDYCCILVDGNATRPEGFGCGEYLHVPGVGGETRQRVYCRTEPGDQLYVRETHAVIWDRADHCGCLTDPADELSLRDYCPNHMKIEYRADTGAAAPGGWEHEPPENRLVKWSPSIHMPKDLARINLRVTAVHAERIQDITNDGAKAEGIRCGTMGSIQAYPQGTAERRRFSKLWNSIYAARGQGWADNAWCWVVKFEVMP